MTATCTHVDQITVLELPGAVEGCAECPAGGGSWVHLDEIAFVIRAR